MSTYQVDRMEAALDAGFDPHDAELQAAYRPNLNWTPVVAPVYSTLDTTAPFSVMDYDGFEMHVDHSLRGAQQDVVDR